MSADAAQKAPLNRRNGIFATFLNPVGVKFCFHHIRICSRIQQIQSVNAVNNLELGRMIVVTENKAVRLGNSPCFRYLRDRTHPVFFHCPGQTESYVTTSHGRHKVISATGRILDFF